ncbi:restriction endonuclease subunit S [Fructilactobacillus vespulae]|uniref:restriction endonuclease subunit S n=1 Tax=Fructilactobacillus vespulae TaxID=1249630 RepID=UPI0039B3DF61
MQQLFSVSWRFAEFNDPWKQRKLGELAKIYRGSSPRPIKDKKWFSKDSNIGWLRISDVTSQNGVIEYTEQHLSKLGMEKTRVLTNEHLILSIAASVGKPVINKIPIGIHDGFIVFVGNKFNIYFMFQMLNYYKNVWNKYGQPGAQVNINSDIVKLQSFYFPKNKEQGKIVVLFKKIDQLITDNDHKVENLKIVKKQLMQNLFI